MPRSTASAGVVSRHLAVADLEPAAVMRSEAGERARQLLAARADDAGDPEDFPGAELETDIPVRPCRSESPSTSSNTRGWNGFCKGSR